MKAKSTVLHIDPETVAVLQARARHARSEAVHNVIVQLIHKLTPSFDLRLGRLHWG